MEIRVRHLIKRFFRQFNIADLPKMGRYARFASIRGEGANLWRRTSNAPISFGLYPDQRSETGALALRQPFSYFFHLSSIVYSPGIY
jgi:hypothetical protein